MGVPSYEQSLENARRVQSALPFLLLCLGPTVDPCPLHSKFVPLVLPTSHQFWDDFPCRQTDQCRCWIRSVSNWEMNKLRTEGTQDPFAPPIRAADGRLTGFKEKRLVPIRETI